MPTREDLKYFQSMPLDIKVAMTKTRIREWVNHYGQSGTYISFSGGKDSTVLLHLVRELYPDVPAVFVDTGLEYPEIRKFVKKHDNVTILRPSMNFVNVIKKYGYPVIGKEAAERVDYAKRSIKNNGESYLYHYIDVYGKFPTVRAEQLYGEKYKDRIQRFTSGSRYNYSKWEPLVHVDFNVSSMCCGVMKKKPLKKYAHDTGRYPITAQMAQESQLREQNWLKHGCNAFEAKKPISNPMSFWTEQDVLRYVKENNVPICSVYGEIIPDGGQLVFDEMECKYCTSGCQRTGCIFCCFGAHLEKSEGRFERLKRTHPKQYAYCMGGGGI